MGERVTQTEYARRRGCSVQAVNQKTTLRGGPIPTYGRRKLIDPAEAEALWPAGTNGRPAPGRDVARHARAKAARMAVLAEREALELRVRRGECVDRKAGERLLFAFARMQRDRWLNWPARIGPGLAVGFGIGGAGGFVGAVGDRA